jgi:hypothetical protein
MLIDIPARSEIKAKIYGKDFILKKPTVGEIELLQEESDKITDNKGKSVLMRQWIAKLGLPEDFTKEMELDHLMQVVEHLTGTKKK